MSTRDPNPINAYVERVLTHRASYPQPDVTRVLLVVDQDVLLHGEISPAEYRRLMMTVSTFGPDAVRRQDRPRPKPFTEGTRDQHKDAMKVYLGDPILPGDENAVPLTVMEVWYKYCAIQHSLISLQLFGVLLVELGFQKRKRYDKGFVLFLRRSAWQEMQNAEDVMTEDRRKRLHQRIREMGGIVKPQGGVALPRHAEYVEESEIVPIKDVLGPPHDGNDEGEGYWLPQEDLYGYWCSWNGLIGRVLLERYTYNWFAQQLNGLHYPHSKRPRNLAKPTENVVSHRGITLRKAQEIDAFYESLIYDTPEGYETTP